jgi:hypothetical protein
VSAALLYIPHTPFYLSNLYSWQPENRVVTRIIAAVSRASKAFFRFLLPPVSHEEP